MEKILGIDLGTTTSVVAVVVNGKPFIIPDQNGAKVHPSIVHFREDGKILVGHQAKPYLILDPENTISSAKRLIGRKFFSPEVEKAKSIKPYKIVQGPNDSIELLIRNNQYTLQEISAMVLKKMKSIAEKYFSESFSKAVITVPAYFNDNQRAATVDAGKIAGLEVLRIINEPTAAALAYGFGSQRHQRVAIYDLGGGTFDVSVLELGDGVFEVVSTAGDTYLGGDDIDEKLISWVVDFAKEKFQSDLRADRVVMQKVQEACERAKHILSVEEGAEIFVPGILRPGTTSFDLRVSLTRTIFAKLIQELMQRTFLVSDEAFQKAHLSVSNLDGLILVGGPTKMPTVREFVQSYFQKQPKTEIDPEQVVAVGAAIQGSVLGGQTSDVVLVDLTPLSLGIEIRGGFIQRIIDINTPLPVDHTRNFTTNVDEQSAVKIRIFQGESAKAQDNELLGEFTLDGLRKAAAGEVAIEVTFEIDTNGILNVTARDVETKHTQSVRLVASGRLENERLKTLENLPEELAPGVV
ncbi:MAG: Hsp70 family protein [Bdellovibrionales bacterium]|nr:Hsp70 family protein [Bdellovibrionales bacterium]